MKPTRALAHSLATLAAADTANLANASAPKVHLIGAAFTPSLDRVLGDLTLLSGNGLDAIAITAGAQNEGVDPLTGESVVGLKPPAGGLRWETSGGLAVEKQIHGYALTNNASATLLAMHRLDEPVILNTDNQVHVAPELTFKFNLNAIH